MEHCFKLSIINSKKNENTCENANVELGRPCLVPKFGPKLLPNGSSGGQVAPSWSQVGPKLEPIGPSWAEVGAFLAEVDLKSSQCCGHWMETVHLGDFDRCCADIMQSKFPQRSEPTQLQI